MLGARQITRESFRTAFGALLMASVFSVGLLGVRVGLSGVWKYFGFAGNLLLAWVPLLFSFATYRFYQHRTPRHWLFWLCGFVWFIFFPNAPYILTDLIHLKKRLPVPQWFDLIWMLSFAWTGFFLGYLSLYLMQEVVRNGRGAWQPPHLLSLYLMQEVVRNWFGRWRSWIFVVVMLLLSSVGIYLGRFLRRNSWDVMLRPFTLINDMRSLSHRDAFGFSVLLFGFFVASYLILYALTHLHRNEGPDENAVLFDRGDADTERLGSGSAPTD